MGGRKNGWRGGIPEVVHVDVVVFVVVWRRRLQLLKPRELELVQVADDHVA